MMTMIRRALGVLRYRRRWSAVAAAVANKADRATAHHWRAASAREGARPGPLPGRHRPS
jgi:hypothetical protein